MTGKETEYIRQAVADGKISGNGEFTHRCQAFFEKAGFISAYTEEGQALVKKLEVYDA